MDTFSILKNLNALYVEDDPTLRSQTASLIQGFFAELYVAGHGGDGLALFKEKTIHLMICDIKMPVMSGIELATEVRKAGSRIPILITSAHTESDDLIESIRLNLADYLVKPFTFVRLKEALSACANKIIENGDLFVRIDEETTYCPLTRELTQKGLKYKLAKKESGLLELLVRNRGRLVSREQIENTLYDQTPMSEAALKNLVLKLRKKVGKERIANVHSVGFLLR